MPITPLPDPPSRSDPQNFAARADAFMRALPSFAEEANALQADVNEKQVQADQAADAAAQRADAAATLANDAADSAAMAYNSAVAAAASESRAGSSAAVAETKAAEASSSAAAAADSAASVDTKNLSSDYAGDTPPPITWPHMTWADTSEGWLKRRSADNADWLPERRLFENVSEAIDGAVKKSGDVMDGSLDVLAHFTVRGPGNRHVWLKDMNGNNAAVIYHDATNGQLIFRLYTGSGERDVRVLNDGSLQVGGTTINKDGNINGATWGGWLSSVVNGKQNALGFTPVQQGGGSGMSHNKVYIGWSTASPSRLLAQVDGVPMGEVVTTAHMGSQIGAMNAGSPGTYAFLLRDDGAGTNPGVMAPGSVLIYAAANGGQAGQRASGTWQCMGHAGTSGEGRATLWMRYA